ncbi:Serine/threonine-protein kinase PknD [Streptomyces sp. RB5]|uniref:Serine/threonine-protein kinase PknD n=1 Tax=Streptomyces smaragdinus TaxID=2585196 RepID=A0A7K0CCC9_9ACTN|nr:penicillin-binding transpeptidase domain-containing protein [Streptomyces smaragdinus]MQY10414.1 Serine/threonine-protein kinase PknD [Streptomyces smaragdinus]
MQPLEPDDPTEIGGYLLRGRLGAGGMGAVYLANTPAGRPVALKVIRREYAQDPEFRRRFAQEVEAARRVHGLYTAQLLDSDTEGPQPWLASAYVPGPSLSQAVSEHGPLPLRTVLQLAAGVAEALAAIHAAGVVHRDLKPSNVLLAEDGPRVIDFGIARASDATALTGADVRLGTPGFMAPEQIRGGGQPGPAIDVFALGLVAHFAATGRHPYGEGASEAMLYRIVAEDPDLTDTPAGLRDLVGRCLAKEPAERPAPAEVVALCRRAAGGELFDLGGPGWLAGTQVTPPSVPEPLDALSTGFGPPPVYPEPTAPSYPAAVTHAPASPAAPTRVPAPGGRRRTGRIAGAVAGALIVVGGTVFAVDRFGDDGGQGGGTPPGDDGHAAVVGLGDIYVDHKPVTGSEGEPFRRTYTAGPLYAPVTGFRSRAFGDSGLEAVYRKQLTTGRNQVLTTIDPAVQKAAFEGLGDHKGAVVALDPLTGKIRALASTPSYDPARFAGNASADEAAWKELNDDPDKPLLNRALHETYPPGFTFSLVTATSAVREGLVKDAGSATDSPEPYTLPLSATQLRNPQPGACENASLTTAFAYSCNTVFGNLSDKLGNGELLLKASDYGFGKELNVPVRAADSTFPGNAGRPQNVLAGIGQGDTRATPLQMAMVIAAIADGTFMTKPNLVQELRRADESVIKRFETGELDSPVDDDTAAVLREALEGAVEESGSPAAIPGMKVGGLAASVQERTDGAQISPYQWFVSYAEHQDGRKVAVAVIVEGKDSLPAAQIARDVMKASLPDD